MKKAFSLIEVIIATSLLSVVMLSLYQVKGNNIFILEKSKENKKEIDYISLLMESKTSISENTNKNYYLDKYFDIEDDDIRREFKEVKIKVKDEVLDTNEEKIDSFSFKINQFETNYSFEKGPSKTIYRFELEL